VIAGGQTEHGRRLPRNSTTARAIVLGTVAMVSVGNRRPARSATLVGGPGFENWKFNLATQARRQPGSSMKAYVLAAALEQGIDIDDHHRRRGNAPSRNPGGHTRTRTCRGARAGVASLIRQTAGLGELRVSCASVKLWEIDKIIAMAKKMGPWASPAGQCRVASPSA